MDLELAGKAAVVTGASRGIGRAIALALAREGCRVALAARGETALEAVVQEIGAAGGHALAVPGDLTLPGSAERLIARAAETFGGLDILVNNLGGSAPANKPFLETEPKDWRGGVGVELYPAVECSRLAVPRFRERGGGVIVI